MKLLNKNSYIRHRNSLKSGDLLAWQGTTSVGRFIRAWTGSNYSHVGIVWRAGERVFIIEASEFAGVRIRPLSNALPCYWLKTHAIWNDAVADWVLGHVGDKYSYLDAFRAGVGIKPKCENGWQCAEFATAVLKFSKALKDDTGITTPQALVQRIIALNS